ncbi:MAG: hypothetical protein U0414_10150 [Polyangiaceae bacterium]
MGRTATCAVEIGAKKHPSVSVLLETDEIVLRTTPRLLVPRSAIEAPIADGDALVFTHEGTRYRLALGVKEAAKWAHDLLHPKTLIDKLDVAPGSSVAVLGLTDEDAPGFREQLAARLGHAPATRLGKDHALVFMAAKARADLEGLPRVVDRLAPGGAIWVVRAKGKAAPPGTPTEADVRAACRAIDLVDVKVARFSDALTAEKYARRKRA